MYEGCTIVPFNSITNAVLYPQITVVNCCECVVEGLEETRIAPRMAVSGGGDGVVKVWDLQLGREVVSMVGHSAEVVSRHTPI